MPSKFLVGTALAGVLLVSGCDGGAHVDTSGGSPAPTTAPTPAPTAATMSAAPTQATPSATAFPDQAAILSQYRAFFASLAPLSRQKYAIRYAAMQKLAVDPELTRVMGGITASQKLGEVVYGFTIIRPSIISVVGSTAMLSDCQDGSRGGRMKVATSKKVTVGRPNQLAMVTMKRGTDGLWRVATVRYALEGSCHAKA